MNELFDDLLASLVHEPTRRNYKWVLDARLRPFSGAMLVSELTVAHCQAFREHRRQQGIAVLSKETEAAVEQALANAAPYIEAALPVVEEIAKLTPNKTDDEIVAAFEHYGVPLLDPKQDKKVAVAGSRRGGDQGDREGCGRGTHPQLDHGVGVCGSL